MKNLIVALFLFATSSAFAAPAQVIIIRHAEKPSEGNDLSPEGYAHAQRLVSYFQNNKDVTQFGTPAAIYAMNPSKEDGSNRAIETVEPLAKALALEIEHPYVRLQYPNLAADLLSKTEFSGKMVLICWEHKVIPDMAVQFGVSPMPSKWEGDDFTTVYRIDFDESGTVKNFSIFSQKF